MMNLILRSKTDKIGARWRTYCSNMSPGFQVNTGAFGFYPRLIRVYPRLIFLCFDESLPLFRRVFAIDRNWIELTPRLAKVGLLPDDSKVIQRIVAVGDSK